MYVSPHLCVLQTTEAVGDDGEAGLASKRSLESVKSADRLLEALTVAAEEGAKWTEYLQDCDSAARDMKRAKGTAAVDLAALGVTAPTKNPMLLTMTPSQ